MPVGWCFIWFHLKLCILYMALSRVW